MNILLGLLLVLIAAGIFYMTGRSKELNKVMMKYNPMTKEEQITAAAELAANLYAAEKQGNIKPFLNALADDYRVIKKVYLDLKTNSYSAPAAEWLLDNFYIIERQYKEIKQGLDHKLYKNLPIIKDGMYKGYPRVYAIAAEICMCNDGRIDDEIILNYVSAFQERKRLSGAELWMMPVMLKIVLISKIRDISNSISIAQRHAEQGEEMANQLTGCGTSIKAVRKLLGEEFAEIPNESYLNSMVATLKKQGRKTAYILSYIETKMKAHKKKIQDVIACEHTNQAMRQISMGNAVISLIAVSGYLWNELFEQMSHVEQILKSDPTNVYQQMDFESRDYYRHIIEKLAKRLRVSEVLVASKALECASEANADDFKKRHIGYYLLENNGRDSLVKKLSSKNKDTTPGSKKTFEIYLWAWIIITLLFGLGIFYLGAMYTKSALWTTLAGLFGMIAASDIVLKIINWAVIKFTPVKFTPKLDFENEIPDSAATFVITTTLLTDEERTKEYIENLEVFYLANKKKNIYFGLVGDFKDGKSEHEEKDAKIIDAAKKAIHALNEKYAEESGQFFYFNRRRTKDPVTKKWMGWERKRGAILEFVRLLKGDTNTGFDIIEGGAIPPVKYIITLDSDTFLTRGSAAKLIGAMAHPLNTPVVKDGAVREGYALMQPKISVDLESANKSFFSKVFAGQGGIDPYTGAVSDVYQDLFSEGIFTGKGIFDKDVFDEVLYNAIPTNTVLSHDLLEGSYTRAALVSDVELIDGFPYKYNAYAQRMHRWIRGDWQIIGWLFGLVKNSEGKRVKNPLGVVSRFKIFDNLRRSIINPVILILIVLGFMAPGGIFAAWLGILTIAASLITAAADAVLNCDKRSAPAKFHGTIIYGLRGMLSEMLIILTFLPHLSYIAADAVIRTIVRVFITHKNMLEWSTAADSMKSASNSGMGYYKSMWTCPVFGVLVLVISSYFTPGMIGFAAIIAALWVAAPFFAYMISTEEKEQKVSVDMSDIKEIRVLSRRIWAYFDDFSTRSENYLVPDNVQVDPPNGIAHRTSPTNIGMLFMAYISAYDLGYITFTQLVKKIDNTLKTVEKMDKWHGHLFNWYDTKTLKMLRPLYVSTVDSGNYIGYIIVLKQGLLKILGEPPIGRKNALGICDTALLANSAGSNFDIKMAEEITADFSEEKLKKLIDGLIIDDVRLENVWAEKVMEMVVELRYEYENPDSLAESVKLCEDIIKRLDKTIKETDFSYLYDKRRQLFSIGYNVEEEMMTKSYYDLLASESRQTSYIAIAKGDVPEKHWFKLGRNLTHSISKFRGLISWTGTMFEYLMPLLVMKNVKNTLLDETYWFSVKSQIRYGKQRQVPWGTSESGFYVFDANLNYQYKAFGVPELGLKRGLLDDMVAAPYATIMALMVDPVSAVANIKELDKYQIRGKYGFYEAIDFTPGRMIGKDRFAVVKSFMVHHQGMSLMAIDNFLNDNIMQKRFHSEPFIKSAENLLSERIPTKIMLTQDIKDKVEPFSEKESEVFECVRIFEDTPDIFPKAHILSNGHYSVVVTDRGTGFSTCDGISVNRTRRSLSEDNYGSFIYIKNVATGEVFSAYHSPVNNPADNYRVIFSNDKAEFSKKEGTIDAHTEISVSAEDNTEIRQISITNRGETGQVIELTSYMEVVLNHLSADISHQTFSNLFVKTEYVEGQNVLIATRRQREKDEPERYLFLKLVTDHAHIGNLEYETDKLKFIGRGGSVEFPEAMGLDTPLSQTVGAVLDPVFAMRIRVQANANETIKVTFVTGVAEDREAVLKVASKYTSSADITRSFSLSWSRSRVESKYLGLCDGEEEMFLELLPHLIFLSPLKQKNKQEIEKNTKSQDSLWKYGISGDLPIVMVMVYSEDDYDFIKSILKAHEYFKVKGLRFDLLIINSDGDGYTKPVSHMLKELVMSTHAREVKDLCGGVFIRDFDRIDQEDFALLHAAAAAVFDAGAGDIKSQLIYDRPEALADKEFNREKEYVSDADFENVTVEFENGFGGFTKNEYVIRLQDGQSTPMPWANILANKEFGSVVTETGGGYTYFKNSRENKLTPWSSDTVIDPTSEVLYFRNEVNGRVFTIPKKPVRTKGKYKTTHGFGYTTYSHISDGLLQNMTVFVPPEDGVKLSYITLQNVSGEDIDLSFVYFVKPVLGVNYMPDAKYIVTSYQDGVLTAKNRYNKEYTDHTMYIAASEPVTSYSGDIRDFDMSGGLPVCLSKERLSGRVGGGLEPCMAIKGEICIKAGETKEMVFALGEVENERDILEAAKMFDVETGKRRLSDTKQYWNDMLSLIEVETPDNSIDYMMNGRLLYQTLASRLFSRTGLYQCGGAFGFRDQLQDVIPVMHIAPEIARTQIIKHAAHQFEEGDVQHWWHEVPNKEEGQGDRGIRTRFSDDLLWLAYVTAEYIEKTGDYQILDETAGYLKDEELPAGVDERYNVPKQSDKTGSIYDHCMLAIDRSLKFGKHSLPLMGSGDWNDGMNTVGNEGEGESVWMGWFLYATLKKCVRLCEHKSDKERIIKYEKVAEDLAKNIEANAWDGSWYLRAYFDDGTPLGSNINPECRIDSLSQSWAVISGAADRDRAKEAMDAVTKYLVKPDLGIISLFTPPFDTSDLSPGYIKGYVPGVRENGGQYTHAAAWTVMAYALLGESELAIRYFNMINPINHTKTQMDAIRYKTEPYAVAADVYSAHPNAGRGGWTFYTGSAGWLFTVMLEYILGIRRQGNTVTFSPSIIKEWKGFTVNYRHKSSLYRFEFLNPDQKTGGVSAVYVNDQIVEDKTIQLADDGNVYHVKIIL